MAKKKVGTRQRKAPAPAKSGEASGVGEEEEVAWEPPQLSPEERESMEREQLKIHRWAKEWFEERQAVWEAASAEIGQDPFERVFQGRWPLQRKLAFRLLAIHEDLFFVGDFAKGSGDWQQGEPDRLEEGLEFEHRKEELFPGIWELGRALEEAKPTIGSSPEWREAYGVWAGLRLSLNTPIYNATPYRLVHLADTWCGPLALCAGRLAAAGNLGEPGPVTEWSPPMTRHRLASILDVSEKTIDRWIERGEAVGKGIKREGRGRFKLTIQALDSKSLERFRKAFPASK